MVLTSTMTIIVMVLLWWRWEKRFDGDDDKVVSHMSREDDDDYDHHYISDKILTVLLLTWAAGRGRAPALPPSPSLRPPALVSIWGGLLIDSHDHCHSVDGDDPKEEDECANFAMYFWPKGSFFWDSPSMSSPVSLILLVLRDKKIIW